MEIARPAGLRSGAAQAFATERLRSDHGADHVAIDVAVADAEPSEDPAGRIVDSAVDAEGQRVAGRGDLVEHRVEPVGRPADHMQDWPEHLAFEPASRIDLEGARRKKAAMPDPRRQPALVDEAALTGHPRGM